MLILFFVVWGLDAFILNYSTVLVACVPFFLRLFLASLALSVGGYLAMKAHRVVFNDQPTLIDIGVYAWVRHPMYLGILLVCLGCLLAVPSILALTIWIAFFLIYNKMTTYEETDLKRILGEKYAAYQKRVPKWFPRLVRQS
jgi:protein-S-isoprenylcysteine O-methyltransferase Ste14